MTLKSSRKPVLAGLFALLLLGFAGASFGAIRFDVIPSPTEVINTGRSEVLGSINMVVRGTGNLSGSSLNGPAQIGIIYNNPCGADRQYPTLWYSFVLYHWLCDRLHLDRN